MFFFSSPACEWRMILRTVGIYLAVTTAIRIFSFHASPPNPIGWALPGWKED
jgi:hypothetical protein